IPEIDHPFSAMPSYVVPCGPIVRAAPAVADVDPPLAAWLSRGPTVYISLGTHLAATAAEAAEMARALRRLLDQGEATGYGGGRTLHVLWKLRRNALPGKRKPDSRDYSGDWQEVRDVLGPRMDADQVRIADWVT